MIEQHRFLRARGLRAAALIACVLAGAACATTQSGIPGDTPVQSTNGDDTTGRANVPPGYGTLKQDEIAIRIELQGLIVRAIPLDENLIRLLTADS
ncbi:MAG: hypothetical protein M3365_01805, partial [Gemmatimonadota bacterium]|nr:hypothetical protein [Gemmatimonadota bacterium]